MKKIIFEQLKDCRSKWGCIKLLKKVISVVHTWTSVLIIFVLYLYSKLQTDKEITFMLSFLVQCIIHPAGGCHWLVPCVEDVISQSQIDHLPHPIFGCGAQTSKNIWNCFKEKVSSISPIFEMQKLLQTASLLQIFLHCRCSITRNSLLGDD